MIITLLIAFGVLLLGLTLLFLLQRQQKRLGVLAKAERIYQDTEKLPGKVLYAKSIPLVGKPDYLIKQGEYIIPIEKKESFAPPDQYLNHVCQLMAYCYIVEEVYG